MPFPKEAQSRYSWLPSDLRSFLEAAEIIVSPDSKSWFNTSADLSGKSKAAAFAWNQWELDSLAAAEGSLRLQKSIRGFWDDHFPFMLSVKDGYAYMAIQKRNLTIVCGEEPEYEEATTLANSFEDFLRDLCTKSPRLSRWI